MIQGNVLIIEYVRKTVEHVNRGKDEKTLTSMKNSFKLIHELNCVINHHGSPGSKEVDGLTECFQGPEKDRKLRYIDYLGNGDSKSFLEISKLDIYPQKQVKKLECVGWCYSKAIG